MTKKSLLPIIVLIISLTFALFVIGTRGDILQSSLIGSGTGASFETISLSKTTELTVLQNYSEEQDAYEASLGEAQGFYLPKVYRTEAGKEGMLEIALALDSNLLVGKKLGVTLRYPKGVVQYTGVGTLRDDQYLIQTSQNFNDGLLRIEFAPFNAEGFFEFPAGRYIVFQVPFLISGDLQEGDILAMQIVGADRLTLEEELVELNFDGAPRDIIHILPAPVEPTRGTLSGEVGLKPTDADTLKRIVLTQESPNTSTTPSTTPITDTDTDTNTNTNTTQTTEDKTSDAGTTTVVSTPKRNGLPPLITNDKTRVSPEVVREGSGETIFLYVSIFDPDSTDDIRRVALDLSNIGLAEDVTMTPIESYPTYTVYALSLKLPDEIQGRSVAYELPYTIIDKQTHVVPGSLALTVESTAPLASTEIDPDLNGDGVVNQTDLSLFLEAYKQAQQ